MALFLCFAISYKRVKIKHSFASNSRVIFGRFLSFNIVFQFKPFNEAQLFTVRKYKNKNHIIIFEKFCSMLFYSAAHIFNIVVLIALFRKQLSKKQYLYFSMTKCG